MGLLEDVAADAALCDALLAWCITSRFPLPSAAAVLDPARSVALALWGRFFPAREPSLPDFCAALVGAGILPPSFGALPGVPSHSRAASPDSLPSLDDDADLSSLPSLPPSRRSSSALSFLFEEQRLAAAAAAAASGGVSASSRPPSVTLAAAPAAASRRGSISLDGLRLSISRRGSTAEPPSGGSGGAGEGRGTQPTEPVTALLAELRAPLVVTREGDISGSRRGSTTGAGEGDGGLPPFHRDAKGLIEALGSRLETLRAARGEAPAPPPPLPAAPPQLFRVLASFTAEGPSEVSVAAGETVVPVTPAEDGTGVPSLIPSSSSGGAAPLHIVDGWLYVLVLSATSAAGAALLETSSVATTSSALPLPPPPRVGFVPLSYLVPEAPPARPAPPLPPPVQPPPSPPLAPPAPAPAGPVLVYEPPAPVPPPLPVHSLADISDLLSPEEAAAADAASVAASGDSGKEPAQPAAAAEALAAPPKPDPKRLMTSLLSLSPSGALTRVRNLTSHDPAIAVSPRRKRPVSAALASPASPRRLPPPPNVSGGKQHAGGAVAAAVTPTSIPDALRRVLYAFAAEEAPELPVGPGDLVLLSADQSDSPPGWSHVTLASSAADPKRGPVTGYVPTSFLGPVVVPAPPPASVEPPAPTPAAVVPAPVPVPQPSSPRAARLGLGRLPLGPAAAATAAVAGTLSPAARARAARRDASVGPEQEAPIGAAPAAPAPPAVHSLGSTPSIASPVVAPAAGPVAEELGRLLLDDSTLPMGPDASAALPAAALQQPQPPVPPLPLSHDERSALYAHGYQDALLVVRAELERTAMLADTGVRPAGAAAVSSRGGALVPLATAAPATVATPAATRDGAGITALEASLSAAVMSSIQARTRNAAGDSFISNVSGAGGGATSRSIVYDGVNVSFAAGNASGIAVTTRGSRASGNSASTVAAAPFSSSARRLSSSGPYSAALLDTSLASIASVSSRHSASWVDDGPEEGASTLRGGRAPPPPALTLGAGATAALLRRPAGPAHPAAFPTPPPPASLSSSFVGEDPVPYLAGTVSPRRVLASSGLRGSVTASLSASSGFRSGPGGASSLLAPSPTWAAPAVSSAIVGPGGVASVAGSLLTGASGVQGLARATTLQAAAFGVSRGEAGHHINRVAIALAGGLDRGRGMEGGGPRSRSSSLASLSDRGGVVIGGGGGAGSRSASLEPGLRAPSAVNTSGTGRRPPPRAPGGPLLASSAFRPPAADASSNAAVSIAVRTLVAAAAAGGGVPPQR